MLDITTIAPEGSHDIALARLYDAGPETLWQALTDVEALAAWWAPDGCQIETHEADIRPGGIWHYTLTTPDGKSFNNRHKYLELNAPSQILYWQGEQPEDDNAARTTIELKPVGAATLLSLRIEFSSHHWREKLIPMGAITYPGQSLVHLDAYLHRKASLTNG